MNTQNIINRINSKIEDIEHEIGEMEKQNLNKTWKEIIARKKGKIYGLRAARKLIDEPNKQIITHT